ncbi:uncharacterized protein AKAW2_80984S [Aspergillus luchuensis]|uniref:Uncharacterized protein n=1 Tax=Aspergillus kawachii TaxID=1069201 RepID=A0A7R8A5T2_ASPKA|nr:uncharacterized protein AKAW2_80984S [Aspergillus luchuensis]BCS05183.1 hypothetical protein AKAW2_80984S [Aspergillus luchuensis]
MTLVFRKSIASRAGCAEQSGLDSAKEVLGRTAPTLALENTPTHHQQSPPSLAHVTAVDCTVAAWTAANPFSTRIILHQSI